MDNLTTNAQAYAAYVALRVDDWQPHHGCCAWVESRDSQCGKTPLENQMLCNRHKTIALKRHEKNVQKEQAQQQQRVAYRARMLPEWQAELEQVEADMERYGGSPTTDRAAYGGLSHPSIQRAQLRQLSDTNVQRMARLSERAQRLREQIGGK